MKKLILALTGAVVAFLVSGSAVLAQDFPSPRGFVSDYANVLSAEAITTLTNRLAQLEKDTAAEVAIVTVDSLGGYSIEEYAAGLFAKWAIGKKYKDNGVLFILASQERKVRIEVGYGLEGVITDGRAGRILDRDVIPRFRELDYEQGFIDGGLSIEQYIRDGTPPTLVEENPVKSALDGFDLPMPLIIVMGILTIYVLGFMARTRSIWLGGIWGVVLGLLLGFGFGATIALILMPIGLGILGLILDAIMSANFRGRSGSGMSTGWFSSGGGFRGPSSFGGGFGGFGGGSSGGGGSSRSF